jgi:hypothetical protein
LLGGSNASIRFNGPPNLVRRPLTIETKLSTLPVNVHGRLNILRLKQDFSYSDELGYKDGIGSYLLYVSPEELKELREIYIDKRFWVKDKKVNS